MREWGAERKGGIKFGAKPKDRQLVVRMVKGPQPSVYFLYLDLAAELDDAVRRNAKELGCIQCVVGHQNEQRIAPTPPPAMVGTRPRPQFLAADDEGSLHEVEAEPADPALRERTQDVRLVAEAVADPDRVEALAEFGDFEPLLVAKRMGGQDRGPSVAACR